MKEIFSRGLLLVRARHRVFMAIGGFVLTAYLLDFVLRVYVPRDDELRKFVTPTLRPFPKTDSVDVIQQRLAAVLPEPASASDAPAATREISLQGIFGSSRQKSAVLVLAPQGDQPLERRTLQRGGEIEGWSVQTISRSAVTLQKGSERRELRMFRGKEEGVSVDVSVR